MKASIKMQGHQGHVGQPHTSGAKPRTILRRPISHKSTSLKEFRDTGDTLTKRVIRRNSANPSSIRRPDDYQINETQNPLLNILPTTVNACDGRNDRIHLHCKICTVICDTTDDAQDFIFHLGGPPPDLRDYPEQYSRLFTTAPFKGSGWKLKIRSTPFVSGGQTYQRPLFSGLLKFQKRPLENGKIAIFITADLKLNVNRALNHRRSELATNQNDAIFKRDGAIKRGLCSKDNLAPLDLLPGEHDNARSAYIELVMAALLADVRRAARVSMDAGSEGINVTGSPTDYSLWKLETCWDIGAPGFDAAQAMDDLSPALREWGGKKGWEGNWGNVTIDLIGSVQLTLYVKKHNRLRIEIRHTPPEGTINYTATTVDGIIAKMDVFREDATKRLNPLLPLLLTRLPGPSSQQVRESYILAWGARCGNGDASKAILGMLLRERRVFGGTYIEDISGGQKILQKALKAGLVRFECKAYRPIFPNSPLTSCANSASFPGHNTETQPVVSAPKSPTPIRIVRERQGIPPPPPSLIFNELCFSGDVTE